jgi:hypothetical protein
MSAEHPASAGLRKLADLLDQAAADGAGLLAFDPYVAFHIHGQWDKQPALLAEVTARFGGQGKPEKDSCIYDHCTTVEGLRVRWGFWADAVCMTKTVTRQVKVRAGLRPVAGAPHG